MNRKKKSQNTFADWERLRSGQADYLTFANVSPQQAHSKLVTQRKSWYSILYNNWLILNVPIFDICINLKLLSLAPSTKNGRYVALAISSRGYFELIK